MRFENLPNEIILKILVSFVPNFYLPIEDYLHDLDVTYSSIEFALEVFSFHYADVADLESLLEAMDDIALQIEIYGTP